jgi:hypothetical protein
VGYFSSVLFSTIFLSYLVHVGFKVVRKIEERRSISSLRKFLCSSHLSGSGVPSSLWL